MTNMKSYMAYQMAPTPVTLNDSEVTLLCSYLTPFNSLFGKYSTYYVWYVYVNWSACTWPMTLNDLQLNNLEGYSPVSGLFKCESSIFVQQFTKILTGTPTSHRSSATAGLLCQYTLLAVWVINFLCHAHDVMLYKTVHWVKWFICFDVGLVTTFSAFSKLTLHFTVDFDQCSMSINYFL